MTAQPVERVKLSTEITIYENKPQLLNDDRPSLSSSE